MVRCQAVCSDGQQCPYNAVVGGLCMKHWVIHVHGSLARSNYCRLRENNYDTLDEEVRLVELEGLDDDREGVF